MLDTFEVVRVRVTRPIQAYTGNNTPPVEREMVIVFKSGYSLIVSQVAIMLC